MSEYRTVAVFRFSELSDEAKARAIQSYSEDNEYLWAEEAIASLRALAVHLHGSLRNYSVDFFGAGASHSTATFDMSDLDDDVLDGIVQSLGSYDAETLRGDGDCVLTGSATRCSEANLTSMTGGTPWRRSIQGRE